MNKRDFLKSFALYTTALATLSVTGACKNAKSSEKTHKHWVWVHGDSKKTADQWTAELTKMKQLGVSAILPSGGLPILEILIPIAKNLDIEVHAWQWAVNRPGDAVAKEHPEWFMVNKKGDSCFDKPPYVDYYRWLCPSREDVRQHIVDSYQPLTQVEGLTGIHLDYIRYPDVILPTALQPKYGIVQDQEYPEWDYCYCPHCQSEFKKQTGIDIMQETAPAKIAAWNQFRYDNTTKLVNAIYKMGHAANKFVSAAVFPYPQMSREMVRQSWSDWTIDAVFPMIYHGFYNENIEWIAHCVKEGKKELKPEVALYAGLFLPDFKNNDELLQAVRLATEAGASGVSLFSNNDFKEDTRLN